MQREACGTALGRPAWVRFSVRPRDLISFVGSCARRFGLSGRLVLRWQGHAGPRPHLQARQRRPRQVRPGVYGFESLSPAPVRFAAEAVLTAYTLMACGRGRGRRLTATSSARNGNPMEPLVAGPALSAARRRKPRSPPSGETVRAGVAGPRLAAPQFPTRWPGVRPHATGRQDSGRS